MRSSSIKKIRSHIFRRVVIRIISDSVDGLNKAFSKGGGYIRDLVQYQLVELRVLDDLICQATLIHKGCSLKFVNIQLVSITNHL